MGGKVRIGGAAAWLALAVIAQPAFAAPGELPAGKAAPGPRPLERCPEPLEEGFFRIPDTNTCLAIGGIVETTAVARSTGLREVAEFAFGVNASFAIDARTPTEWGEQRTFFRATAYNTDPNFTVDYAFVSLPGMTAGLTDSLFYFLGNGPALSVLRSPNLSSTQLRYRLSLPAGMTMGFSLESAAQARPSSVPPLGEGLLPALRTSQAGARLPDAVAALSTEGDWGSARVAAVAHQVRSIVTMAGNTLGFAALAGVEINIPQGRKASPKTDRQGSAKDETKEEEDEDTPTDTMAAQVVLAQAATAYLGFSTGIIGRSGGVGTVDTIVGPTGKLVPVQGLSTMAYYAHVWKPRWTQNLFGSFAVLDVGQGQFQPLSLIRDVREWRLGTNLVYTPVDGLDITFEALWIGIDPRGTVPSFDSLPRLLGRDSAAQAVVQVTRTF